jgi:ubiquinone/menaquinone biosynthesis C-methylase UbiE
MSAHYDSYDYQAYWKDRVYEHNCETIAIKSFLLKIPKIDTVLDIGAGYGRLVPSYIFRAKKVIISDPSSKLLAIARRNFFNKKKIKIVHSKIETLKDKIGTSSADCIIMVRVLHHLGSLNAAISTVHSLLKPGGYLILEFANKNHFKSTLKEFLHGNVTFAMDIFPRDIRSKKSIKNHTIAFNNYHPEIVKTALQNLGFRIVEIRSVSNIRSLFAKKFLPESVLLLLEKYIQIPLSIINFGPSIFILAQKTG